MHLQFRIKSTISHLCLFVFLIQAYKLGMTGSTFTWLLPGWYEDNWWKLNDTSCTYAEIKEAVSCHIGFNTVSLAEQNTNTDVFRVNMLI